MPWQSRMGPASFRGAKFRVEIAELGGGRKTVVHEYPFRDKGYAEDLGLRVRAYSIQGYILGLEYFADRDALITALETPGPARLEHPYFGSKLVSVRDYRTRESRDEGGYVEFQIEFVETEASPFAPDTAVAAKAAAATASTAVLATSKEWVSSSLITALPIATANAPALPGEKVRSLPTFALASASGLVRGFAEKVRTVLSPIAAGAQYVADLNAQIDGLVLDTDALIRQPATLATLVHDVFANLISVPATPSLGLSALFAVYGFEGDTPRPTGTTAARLVEARNYDVLDTALRVGIVAQLVRVAAELADDPVGFATHGDPIAVRGMNDAVTFLDISDVIAVRTAVIEALDAQAEFVTDIDVADALAELRAQLVESVPGDIRVLPRFVSYTPPVTVPALVLAYRLHGSLAHEPDLVTRNRIRHPGFVVGGVPVQVVVNA